jgi:uncharacterized protein YyaL (SSP411 family)
MLDAVHSHWTQNFVLSVHDDAASLAETHPAAGKTAIEAKPTVYVCHGETCSLPVTEPDAITRLLA